MKIELIATASFGLEAVVRREIEALGYKVLKTEDGRITYLGDERAIVRSNLWLRTADRVYVRMGEFNTKTFEELFQEVKAFPWEKYITVDGCFPVVGTSVKSELHSVPACQSIVKKAVVSRLGAVYNKQVLPESGAEYRIRFSALKNKFTLMIDTSGAGLHKRGYRIKDVEAPIKETLAAAIVQLSFYRPDKILVDTCCGSGTIPIEAAMIARNIAPGLGRSFACSDWQIIPGNIWKEEKKFAYEAGDFEKELRIKAIDIDTDAIKAAEANADEAGVLDDIEFFRMDMTSWKPEGEYGVIITNPPYGERIGDRKAIERIYKKLGKVLVEEPTWSMFMITTDRDIEKKFFGRKADRRRKLYNGRLETQLYQYHGVKPGRERK